MNYWNCVWRNAPSLSRGLLRWFLFKRLSRKYKIQPFVNDSGKFVDEWRIVTSKNQAVICSDQELFGILLTVPNEPKS